MVPHNKRLLVIAIVTLVGSLGYGIVIPVLYSYSFRYGLSALALGVLFSTFSICEFISTPFIGMLSDQYGRRPLLIASLIGTASSFFLIAFAPSAAFLFLARALDGSTAGNLPIAQAIISDTTETKDRTRGFGIIGACYGIGLVGGPAIAALTVGISMKLPFIVAGTLAGLGIILTILLLDETNSHIGRSERRKIFEWKKLAAAITKKGTGLTLLVSFLWSFAFGMFIYSYQPFSLNTLHFSPTEISLSFFLFGVIAVATQLFVVSRISKRFGNSKALTGALSVLGAAFLILIFFHELAAVILSIIMMGASSSAVQTFVQALLSEATPPEKQGEILGLGASYISMGQIIGPITAGSIAVFGVVYSFGASFILTLSGLLFSRRIKD